MFRRPVNITQPDYKIYHRMDSLLAEVDALVSRHPSIMRDALLESEVGGYSTSMRVVTISPDGSFEDSHKLRVLLNFGEHARELVSSELALQFLSMLAGERNGSNILPRLEHTVIKVIPMENVHGRVKVEAGDLCERKNGRGVDTNRNWEVDWGKKEKDYDPNEEYPGTAPFSEPETRILKQLVKEFDPHVWVNVHSGMEALFMPYDHKKMTPNDSVGVALRKLLQLLNEQHCQGRCAVGSGGTSVGYLSHGTATDYIYDIAKVPIALTLEIYGDERAPNEDCFRMFNPISQDQLEEVITKWSAIFFSLLANLPSILFRVPTGSSSDPVKLLQDPKFGRVWQGMDSTSMEGLRTPEFQISLQSYLFFCLLLLILIWLRYSKYYRRFFPYIRPISQRL